jgi:broad specificity phosphatase PhoE
VALSSEGLEQAAIVADLLGTLPIAAVYSSPRERAWYTARDIADPHELKPQLLEGLDEIDFGEWSGRSFAELEGDDQWQQWNEARSVARCPGGESMDEAVARAVRAIEAVAASHHGETAVAVTHCDIIRGVIAHYLGLSLDNILRFDVEPASISTIKISRWGGRVRSINERLYQ